MRRPLLIALLLTIPCPVYAQGASAQTPVTIALSQKTVELMDLIAPTKDLSEQVVEDFQSSFSQTLENDPEIASIEKQRPGLKAAIYAAIDADMQRSLPLEIAHMRGVSGLIYQRILDDKDIDTAIAFFRSPAGARLLTRIKAGGQNAITEEQKAGQKNVGSLLDKGLEGVVTSGLQGLSPADSSELAKFGRSAAGVKLATARLEMLSVMTAELEGMGKRLVDRLGPVVDDAIQHHLNSK